jgi:hypothetical protein
VLGMAFPTKASTRLSCPLPHSLQIHRRLLHVLDCVWYPLKGLSGSVKFVLRSFTIILLHNYKLIMTIISHRNLPVRQFWYQNVILAHYLAFSCKRVSKANVFGQEARGQGGFLVSDAANHTTAELHSRYAGTFRPLRNTLFRMTPSYRLDSNPKKSIGQVP